MWISVPLRVTCWLFLSCSAAFAQAPGEVPAVVDDEALEQKLEAGCLALREAKLPVHLPELLQRLARTQPVELEVAPAASTPLAAPDLRDRVLRSLRIVLHHYRCSECDKWHVNGASGFCVDARGTIATCRHVVPPDASMLEAELFVADLAGTVWAVEDVLVADDPSDVVLLRTTERGGVGLPWRREARVGERVYCASNPDHRFGFFSEGLLARRFVSREPHGGEDPKIAVPRVAREWLHVTADFARGSSGGPIVDACGNVLGLAQSTTTVVHDEEADLVDTQMVFKIATPIAALLERIRPPAPKVPPAGR
jgi:hypothetical protein